MLKPSHALILIILALAACAPLTQKTKEEQRAGNTAEQTINAIEKTQNMGLEQPSTTAEEPVEKLTINRSLKCKNLKPAIYNIGQGSTVVFDGNKRSATRIAIDGRDLYPECVNFNLTITGDVPLVNSCSRSDSNRQQHAKDYVNSEGADIPFVSEDCHIETPGGNRPDIASLVLKPAYTERLHSGDRITIQVTISDKSGNIEGCDKDARKCRAIAYATRSFTMYKLDDYREKLKHSRVDIRDINAFPLTNNEINNLFGPVIENLYYVVRLSVTNQEGVAKLINTGMIRAEGRAIVEPDKETDEPIYTVPVTVVPQSLQHVYSIIDGTEPYQPRAWVFRSLEFAGALGTAINALGTVTRATTNWGLFTGVAIPEAKKLWPDAVPSYRKNLVDYAMPDLLKVAANSQTGHKYLFFPKKNIETVVSDPRMYLPIRNGCDQNNQQSMTNCDVYNTHAKAAPSSRVISLAFDHLDIRFDNVTNVEIDTAKADLLRLIVEFPRYMDGDFKNATDKNKQVPTKAEFVTSSKRISDHLPDGLADGDKTAITTAISRIKTAIDGDTNTPSIADALQILEKGKKYGAAALELDRKSLNTLTSAYSKGEDISLYAKELNKLSSDLENSKKILALSNSLRDDFAAIDKLFEGSYTKDNISARLISPLQSRLGTINAAVASLKDLDGTK